MPDLCPVGPLGCANVIQIRHEHTPAALLLLRQSAQCRAYDRRGGAVPATCLELLAAFLHWCPLSLLNAGSVSPAPEPRGVSGTTKGTDVLSLMQQTLPWVEQWWPASSKVLAFWVFGSFVGGKDRHECSDCPRERACLKWEHRYFGHRRGLRCWSRKEKKRD